MFWTGFSGDINEFMGQAEDVNSEEDKGRRSIAQDVQQNQLLAAHIFLHVLDCLVHKVNASYPVDVLDRTLSAFGSVSQSFGRSDDVDDQLKLPVCCVALGLQLAGLLFLAPEPEVRRSLRKR